MALDDDIRILSRVPLFEGFTADQLRLLAFGAERLELGAGDVLYREGDRADCAFILVEGAVELFRREDGKSLGRVRPGALMGELALIVAMDRPSDAQAQDPTLVLKLDRRAFRRILQEYPELAARLHDRLSRQLVEFARSVERLAPRFAD